MTGVQPGVDPYMRYPGSVLDSLCDHSSYGGFILKARLDAIRDKESKIIIAIETGESPGRFVAVAVEVVGNGDGTVIELHGLREYHLPPEFRTTLGAVANDEKFDSEEIVGINFLALHHLSKLYQEILDETGIEDEEVDLIGLKCLEIGGKVVPDDPASLSEMTGQIVATHFYIGVDNGKGGFLPVEESILQGIVGEIADKFDLEGGGREAVVVALLTNESLFHRDIEAGNGLEGGEGGAGRRSIRSVKETGVKHGGGQACLCGEFFFPA